MLRRVVILTAGALLIAGPASAQNAGSDADEANDISASNRIVCRRTPPPAGSRIGTRNICKTERQWEEIDLEIRTRLDEAFNRSKVFTGN